MSANLRTLRAALIDKLREACRSVVPVAALVVILWMTPLVDLSRPELVTFLISTVFLIIGIAMFNLGADLSMSPMGEYIGTGLSKSRRLLILIFVSFLMGVFITIAEPDLSVLASQVSGVIDGTLLTVTIGIGVGLFLLLAVLKIVLQKDLSSLLLLFYMILFAMVSLLFERSKGSFLALSFDSGGVTTGPITVPFIMALGVGIARSIGGRNTQENSFGLIALCSIGPVLAMLILSMFSKGAMSYEVPDYSMVELFGPDFWREVVETLREVGIALGLIVVFFLILQFTILKISGQSMIKIFVGLFYTLMGLVIFLTAVSVGYMPVGYRIGQELALGNVGVVLLIAFIFGVTTVLAEPAIHVLNHQVEDVTEGTVGRSQMMVALCIGVGASIALSVLRVTLGFSVLYYLIPGYLISLTLSFLVPKLYTAIAFDSGGVASGPLTSSFILPLVIGFCVAAEGADAVLEGAFGMVAMVAMTPLIAIQLLGFRAIVLKARRNRAAMRHIFSAADAEVIRFDWDSDFDPDETKEEHENRAKAQINELRERIRSDFNGSIKGE